MSPHRVDTIIEKADTFDSEERRAAFDYLEDLEAEAQALQGKIDAAREALRAAGRFTWTIRISAPFGAVEDGLNVEKMLTQHGQGYFAHNLGKLAVVVGSWSGFTLEVVDAPDPARIARAQGGK